MIAENSYPHKANIRKYTKGIFSSAALLCGLLLSGSTAFAQTYYNVTNLSGTSTVGGNNVTVAPAGVVSSTVCTGLSQPYVEGSDVLGVPAVGVGSYTWSFSLPVNAIRIHMESIDAIDDVTILINGTPYFITTANITPLPTASTCFGVTGTAAASLTGTIINSGSGTDGATIDIMPGVGITSVTIQSTGVGASAGVVNDFSFASNADPSFVNGGIELFTICESSGLNDISNMLAINDADMGQAITWSVGTAPMHGTTSGFPLTLTSTGTTLTPSGLGYTPTPGFSGFDTLIVSATDGATTILDTLVVTVNPKPTLSSSTTPPSICSGSVFSYVPTSAVGGTVFNWTRLFTGGLSNPTATGTGNPNETLNNIAYYNVPAIYTYSLSANGCSSIQSVSVTVKPIPTLSSALRDTICNGNTFNYPLASATAGATFSWTRASVAGIAPATGSGTGNISEVLSNSTGGAIDVLYDVTINANGCSSVQTVTVTVAPPTVNSLITTRPASVLCNGTMYQNFGTSSVPGIGANYTWTAVNATIDATGPNGQYILVSFTNPGTAVISLNTGIAGSSCFNSDSYSVTVGTSELASADIIFYNHQLIYLDNTPDSYQWGYDDALTLDSTAFAGGEFQSLPITSLDLSNKYYWVITTKNGCMQKTYYNGPVTVGVHNVQANAAVAIYPNPATNKITVTVAAQQGDVTVAITDMMGQTVKTMTGNGSNMQFDLANMPAGCYLVSCTQNGVRVGTSRVIKN